MRLFSLLRPITERKSTSVEGGDRMAAKAPAHSKKPTLEVLRALAEVYYIWGS